jgi:hypothetical protein
LSSTAVGHPCHTLNCKGQGGCGILTEEFCHLARTIVVIKEAVVRLFCLPRFMAQGPNKGLSVFAIKVARFEEKKRKW